jgi:acyl carrier protein
MALSIEAVEQSLTQEVATILCLEPAALTPGQPLAALGLDSMGLVELLVFIEKKFQLRLLETGLQREDFETIHALACRISQSTAA